MKIERDSIRVPNRPVRPGDIASRPAVTPAGQSAATPVDQVSLSDEARQASAARERLAVQPQVRSELIATIKAQIEQGTYQIHSQALAERLLKAGVFAE